MKKKLMLIIPIFLMVIIFMLFFIWKNNDTARIIGFILLVIVSLFNMVRAIDRWNESK